MRKGRAGWPLLLVGLLAGCFSSNPGASPPDAAGTDAAATADAAAGRPDAREVSPADAAPPDAARLDAARPPDAAPPDARPPDAAPPDAAPPCTSNEACGFGRYCSDLAGGECLVCGQDDPAHCGYPCEACGPEQPTCQAGVCVCTDDDTCGVGKYCTNTGYCDDCGLSDAAHCGDASSPPGCTSCTATMPLCDEGVCTCQQTVTTDSCQSTGAGEVCVDGSCAACTASMQCRAGECCTGDPGGCSVPLTWLRTPPEPRSGHVAVYDSANQQMIVFGGGAEAGQIRYVPDTPWAFTLPAGGGPGAFKPLFPSGIGPEHLVNQHAIYDPSGQRMIVWGGEPYPDPNTPTVGEDNLWELDLPPGGAPAWKLLSYSTPTGFARYEAAYDGANQRLIFYAPYYDYYWDVRTFSLVDKSWARLDPYDNAPYAGGVAVFDPVGNRLVAYDGSWVRALSFSGHPTWSLLLPDGTQPYATGDTVYDPVGQRMLLRAGGYLWALSLPAAGNPAWSRIDGAGLPDAATMVYDDANRRLVFFGGYSCNGVSCQEYNDVYSIGLADAGPGPHELLWTAGPAPGPSQEQSAVYDPVGQRMLVYNGAVWSMSLPADDAPRWEKLTPTGTGPSPRSGQTAVWDAGKQRMLVYGGFQWGVPYDTYYGDLYQLAFTPDPVWTPLAQNGGYEGMRTDAAAVYDSANQHMVVFGGKGYVGNTITESSDVFTADLLTGEPYWRQLVPAGPGPEPRRDAAAVYDPVGQRMLVYGGRRLDQGVGHEVWFDDVWALSLPAEGDGEWQNLVPASGYGGVSGATAVYDPNGQRMLTFGGSETYYGPLGDVITSYYNSLAEIPLGEGQTPAWRLLDPTGDRPGPRHAHSAIFDEANDRMVVFGGYGGYWMKYATYDDVWMATVMPCR